MPNDELRKSCSSPGIIRMKKESVKQGGLNREEKLNGRFSQGEYAKVKAVWTIQKCTKCLQDKGDAYHAVSRDGMMTNDEQEKYGESGLAWRKSLFLHFLER